MNNELIIKAEKYCKELLNNGRCNLLQFHNYCHTAEVAHNANLIAQKSNLTDAEREMVVISAYFHDVGNIETASGHEKLSCTIAREFLQKQNFPEEKISIVEHTILSTEMGREPTNLLEEILNDADFSHLGMTTFTERNRLLREEWETFLDMTFTDKEWITLNIKFLEQHHFYTEVAQKIFGKQKSANLIKFKQAI
ncbi:MAG: HD domain-containing protein [Aequorivita sp.]|nr:HD domain-containing protein [Aequorivita sp.]